MSSQDPHQTSPTPNPAATLGKYKIVRLIARSNDVVYEAIDSAMNRRIAVKELALSGNLSGSQKRERIERFYREAKAAGNLSHPHIVTVHEVGQDGERHYIAMEYLEGPSLRDILRMRGSLPIREALTVALQLTEALGYAHSQGVVHRDVKPDNIHLVVPNDAVKLTDFGIARILADPAITSAGQVFGTPSYMSPEQILSREVDHRTDIFSLGVVLYEMIVGKKPFTGDSIITITYHVMNSTPILPQGLPLGVSSLISRALAKDPNLRYQNMAAMAADLHSELAFSESPYHKTIPPGVLTAVQLAEEQTAMIEAGQLPRPGIPSVPTGKYAPPTGIAEAVAGGQVSAATTVTPNILPVAQREEESTKNALLLVGSTIAVMLVVLALVIVIANAYVASRTDARLMQAEKYYRHGNIDQMNHNFDAALADYKRALAVAPPGSQVATYAQSAVAMLENHQADGSTTDSSDSTNDATIAQPSTSPDSSAPAQTPSSTDGQTNPEQAAQADLASAQTDFNGGNWDDAVKQLDDAATIDPTGDAGKQAESQLARIYSDRGDAALKNGQVQAALNDWQLVVKYAPADPLADQARQKILENGTPGQPSGSQSNETSSDSQTGQ